MVLAFDLAGTQIDGARKYQEDAFLVTHLTDQHGDPASLVIVADGMGGHAAGNVASNMAVQEFARYVSAHYPADNLAEVLRTAVLRSNASIKETIKETSALSGMGCTMIACILEAGTIWWASVGDSHLYIIRDSKLTKKNDDHSYGGFLDRMRAAGTPVEQKKDLSRNMLMSALTGDDINEINVPNEPFKLHEDDRVLLCSDGMDTLGEGQIIQHANSSSSPKECAEKLMSAVTEANIPKQDNTTAVMVLVKEATGTLLGVASQAAADAAPDITEPRGRKAKPESAAAVGQREAAADRYETERAGGGKLFAIAAVIVLCAVGGGAWYVLLGPGQGGPASERLVSLMGKASSPSAPPVQVAGQPAPVAEPAPALKVGGAAPASKAVAKTEETIKTPKVAGEEPKADGAVQTPEVVATAEEMIKTPKATREEPKAAPAAAETLQDTLKSGGKGPVMVVVPAGKFQMGASSLSRYADERPRHEVMVEGFAISQYEITVEEYAQFAEAQGRGMPKGLDTSKAQQPVYFVSWDDAAAYVRWLSQETGQRYRLPNEAEWEYVAGYGVTSPFWWGYEHKSGMAHCFDCETGLDPRRPTLVGRFKPNQLGLYDTAGNISEWVHDCWHPDYEGAPVFAEPWEGGDCKYRVARGGSYSDPMESTRVSKRFKFPSARGNDLVGFRAARKVR